jgi:hypothetical protein
MESTGSQLDYSVLAWYSLIVAFIVIVFVPVAKICIKLFKKVQQIRAISKVVHQLPGPEPHWLTGNLHEHPGVNEKLFAYLQDLNEKYPRYYKYFMGSLAPRVIVNHPESIKLILKTSEPKPIPQYRVSFHYPGAPVGNREPARCNGRATTLSDS